MSPDVSTVASTATTAVAPAVAALPAPPIGWAPEVDAAQITIVRPVPWARAVGGIGFHPERWGERVFRIRAAGGDQWLIRRTGAPELALWVPRGLAPQRGGAFGLYLHAGHGLADRSHATDRFRRAIGLGRPIALRPFADARRHAIMLYLFDARLAGTALRASAEVLLGDAPVDWRTSSVRSDLRRLADTADRLAAGGYLKLLR
ncbi:MAG: DUF2285 domain-containing protein [Sphingopyxis sp.]